MDGLLGDKKVPLADTWRATEVKTSADGSDLLQLQEWLKQTENSQPEMNWRSVVWRTTDSMQGIRIQMK